MWTLHDLQYHGISTCIEGEWVPARPINWKYRSLWCKLKEAWAVFTGKADCFKWPKNQ